MPRPRWWLLCRIVDNYGDAGVCWRLARQLADRHDVQVELFCDQPELIHRLAGASRAGSSVVGTSPGGSSPAQGGATSATVQVREWAQAQVDPLLPDVLISAFGCEPPASVRSRLAGGPDRPLWLNLEYLSAENWVEDCHGLAAVDPRDGAVQTFFYPGFTEATGGLSRDPDALATAHAMRRPEARAAWLAEHCGLSRRSGERVITLFCYPDAPVSALLDLLATDVAPHLVLLPDGVAAGTEHRQCVSGLRLARLPFLAQRQFDQMLAVSDLNFVRGEDSWIQAHWAGHPFVWQPYPQADDTHLVKLDAFLARITGRAPDDEPAAHAIAAMMRAWSGQGDLAPAWREFQLRETAVRAIFSGWAKALASQDSLSDRLVAWADRHRRGAAA